jgi:hypothetical protein
MQAIVTKYIGATNARGSRIKATAKRGSIVVPYPHEINSGDVHAYAAQKLCALFAAEDLKDYGTPITKNPWSKAFVSGSMPGSNCTECHIFID